MRLQHFVSQSKEFSGEVECQIMNAYDTTVKIT